MHADAMPEADPRDAAAPGRRRGADRRDDRGRRRARRAARGSSRRAGRRRREVHSPRRRGRRGAAPAGAVAGRSRADAAHRRGLAPRGAARRDRSRTRPRRRSPVRARCRQLLRAGDLVVVNDAATLPALAARAHRARRAVRAAAVGACRRRRDAPPAPLVGVLFGAGDCRTRTEHRPPPPRARGRRARRPRAPRGHRHHRARPARRARDRGRRASGPRPSRGRRLGCGRSRSPGIRRSASSLLRCGADHAVLSDGWLAAVRDLLGERAVDIVEPTRSEATG